MKTPQHTARPEEARRELAELEPEEGLGAVRPQ